jgi:hypothetical protein
VKAAGRNKSRDRELVEFVGRHGVVTVEQVMAAMGAGRTASYRRIAACMEIGLLERLALLRNEPTVLRATRDGLNYAELGLPVAAVTPGLVGHDLRCVDVALLFGGHLGHERVLTEREFTWREQSEGKEIASIDVAGSGGARGLPRKHRADLAVLSEKGTIAIEVELTAKAPTRLEGLLRAWRRAQVEQVVAEVHYLCATGKTRRAVERAATKVGAEDCIAVLELGGGQHG